MKHDELVAAVAARAEVSRRHADEIVLATLTALGERLTADETKDLLAQLPKKYKQHVNAVSSPNAMSADEFVARVAQLEGARAPTFADARRHVSAVFVTLSEAVNAGELRDVLDQLSADFVPLLEPSAPVDVETPVVERERTPLGAVAMAVGVVAGGITTVVRHTRARALDVVVLAVDGLEAITERIDDAAEALQARVHEMAGAASAR